MRRWLGFLAVGAALCGCEAIAPLDEVNAGDASEPAGGCDLLDSSKVLGADGPPELAWRVGLVKLAGSSECVFMDKTEVTVAAYGAWADPSAAFTDWHPWCSEWKPAGPSNPRAKPDDDCAATIPSSQVDPFALDKPIRCVDWCDAEAFCRKARGGHLCHRAVGGGSAQPERQQDEWPSACSNSGMTIWPWGNDMDPTRCNLDQLGRGCGTAAFSCGPDPVQSYSECVDRNGIFDLIGNVQEWLGGCNAIAIATADAPCETAGGGYQDSLATLTCSPVGPDFPKSSRRPDLGFRCCYDLTPAERQTAGLP